MECLYVPTLDGTEEVVIIEDNEYRHLRALRARIGEFFYLSNGRGIRAQGKLIAMEKSTARMVIQRVEYLPGELHRRLTIAVGLIASRERMEWLVEKCTEVGVHKIIPLVTERTEVSTLQRRERLLAKMVAALKQAQRSVLPILCEPMSISELLTTVDGTNIVVCDADGTVPCIDDNNYTIVVGAEGGFSPKELALFEKLNVQRWSLGKLRLRTETAAIAAASMVAIHLHSYMSPLSDRMRERAEGT
ncbi:MAG: RsmE family RNA methyltransferase [Bacteroidota bacterium]|nr:16S rRNA (uracil(1498)-N(3))-methyltransferase [Candidatus Kapabacteria bacterium]MCX7936237.1 16S rRNA (uracil(1498)-N(3))-methyltransferase [Chlorobiota bacterium]MDW8074482.1 RsmE family RNA methyltransferase [Bacteroidota bacterium]MDW8271042.1 RsmE family RNA methyltransferase [Bacteroidota bacterium]